MNKKQKYRHLKVKFVESSSIQHIVGIILQENYKDNSGKCLCKFREDREFINKVPITRFKEQSPDVTYSYGDILLPACERFNKELAVDLRIEVIDPILKAEGRSDTDSIRIKSIRPGDPEILETLRQRQPRVDQYDPESPLVLPYFEFSEWESSAFKEHITIVLSNLIKEIENDR